ncbi:RDD family protein [Campylobacter suis]|uniref:RDD domain-containing protein n=1 Tax=Campylobacter suis TaxID=2790657 RepID=A0ABM8Q7W1_9BACT|nr:RDD family protein [Campylobacter suis]CAD7288865.1 hypothetical protein LMG8286_01566 [Campylobacter suis]
MSQIHEKLEYENISLAPISKRIFAFFIDEFILAGLFMAIYFEYFKGFQTQEEIIAAISGLMLQYISIRTIYHTFFVWYFGATLGKIAMKIACIDIGYLDKPSIGASFLRAVVRNLSESAFYLGFIWAFGNPAKQTWHDKLAKTVVIDVG